MHGSGWPDNELEQVLGAALGQADAGARILEVLGRSRIWVPLPAAWEPHARRPHPPDHAHRRRGLRPRLHLRGPVPRLRRPRHGLRRRPRRRVRPRPAPAARHRPQPRGRRRRPAPPARRRGALPHRPDPLDGPATGGRVRLFEPDWQDDPVDFLTAAAEEFRALGVVTAAHRCLASVEGGAPQLYIGVRLAGWDPEARSAPLEALGRALTRVPAPWPVQLILLDAAQDPVVDYIRERVRPFYLP